MPKRFLLGLIFFTLSCKHFDILLLYYQIVILNGNFFHRNGNNDFYFQFVRMNGVFESRQIERCNFDEICEKYIEGKRWIDFFWCVRDVKVQFLCTCVLCAASQRRNELLSKQINLMIYYIFLYLFNLCRRYEGCFMSC